MILQLYRIFKTLSGDEALLAKLYSFIDTDQPLNPLLASFFSKTLGVLVARKSDQVIIHKLYLYIRDILVCNNRQYLCHDNVCFI